MRTSARQPNTFTSFYCRAEYFQNSFLPYVVKGWNKVDPVKRSCQPYESFRKALRNVVRPSENKISKIHDQVGIKLLTRLRLGLSHLREHKFRHNFEETLNPLCSYSIEAETTLHFFLRRQFFNDIRGILINDLINIERSLPSLSPLLFLLYGYYHTLIPKDIAIPTLLSKSTISNFYQSANWNFWA